MDAGYILLHSGCIFLTIFDDFQVDFRCRRDVLKPTGLILGSLGRTFGVLGGLLGVWSSLLGFLGSLLGVLGLTLGLLGLTLRVSWGHLGASGPRFEALGGAKISCVQQYSQ